MRKEVLVSWGDELPGLHLNLFADELPAAYLRDQTGKRGPEDFPVLQSCEVRAKIRRGCFAEALSVVRDMIADSPFYPEQESWLGAMLPAAFRARYDRDFHSRMLAVTISLWGRMADGTFTEPRCTAEEILLGIILAEYALRLGSAALEPGLVDLDSYWLEDDDYLLLYNSEIAERDDVLAVLADEFYAFNLNFASWFKPFEEASPIPGPTTKSALRKIKGG